MVVENSAAASAGYRLSYVHVVRVRAGKIVLLRDYVDARAIAERLAAPAIAATPGTTGA
jgi:ketosteroid isomerase-like protein